MRTRHRIADMRCAYAMRRTTFGPLSGLKAPIVKWLGEKYACGVTHLVGSWKPPSAVQAQHRRHRRAIMLIMSLFSSRADYPLCQFSEGMLKLRLGVLARSTVMHGMVCTDRR